MTNLEAIRNLQDRMNTLETEVKNLANNVDGVHYWNLISEYLNRRNQISARIEELIQHPDAEYESPSHKFLGEPDEWEHGYY